MPIPVIAVFDIGKTNKKILLFSREYELLQEKFVQVKETVDEDNFPCEDLTALTSWVIANAVEIGNRKEFEIRAINFSAYGASLVHLNDQLKPFLPLYNYLKPYPEELKRRFYETYGGETAIASETASPVLGSLNAGMQLYRLKHEKHEIFKTIKYSLHLPQYLSFLFCGKPISDLSSIGCHTNLWHFAQGNYHRWVYNEGIDTVLAPITVAGHVEFSPMFRDVLVGTGLHDSSAALIPYLREMRQPFILLSTGTWSITLNPFNQIPLTEFELQQDCLCYLSHDGRSVKAARLFAGAEHEKQVKRLDAFFHKQDDYYRTVRYDPSFIAMNPGADEQENVVADFEPDQFSHYEMAYHYLIDHIVKKQVRSTRLVIADTSTKNIFVDGGFSQNEVYMYLLAKSFPGLSVSAATVPQASALGAALAIHRCWNENELARNLVTLKCYSNDHTDL